jgi:hypothetical protein
MRGKFPPDSAQDTFKVWTDSIPLRRITRAMMDKGEKYFEIQLECRDVREVDRSP